jgi:predicted ATPase
MSQFKDPLAYPELNYLGETLPQIKIYTDWSKGRYAAFRQAQPTDLSGDFLQEDFANLPHVINRLDSQEPEAMAEIATYFGRFYEGFEGLKTSVEASTIRLLLKERGLYPIPATRLSDGTLNFLCLCALLLHLPPPPLMIFDEPELGLHPDILPMLGEMLISASERTQLIVTTHSTGLVEAIGETTPESVVVCERDEEGTRMGRLDPDQLKVWMERYTLGGLWTKGIIGGNRW